MCLHFAEKQNFVASVLKILKRFWLVLSSRKSSKDEEVITLAKSLIKTWKKFVPETNAAGDKAKDKKKDESKRKDDKNGGQDGNSSKADEALVRSFPAKPQATADEVSFMAKSNLPECSCQYLMTETHLGPAKMSGYAQQGSQR